MKLKELHAAMQVESLCLPYFDEQVLHILDEGVSHGFHNCYLHLQGIQPFSRPKVALEQYPTGAEIASRMLFTVGIANSPLACM